MHFKAWEVVKDVDNCVYIWKFQNQFSTDNACRLAFLNLNETNLSADEKVRAKRILIEKARLEFIENRMIMRNILSEYLDIPSAKIEFIYNSYGKPLLKNNKMNLQFNLSHSNGVGILAVSIGKNIGVDIEYENDSIDFRSVARTQFSTAENKYFEQLNYMEKKEAFYRIWTMKEAFVKAVGEGLSIFPQFDVPVISLVGKPQPNKLYPLRNWYKNPTDWKFYHIDTNLEKYHVSLVVENADESTEIKIEDYEDQTSFY